MGGGKGKGGGTIGGTLPRMENSGRMGENRVNWALIFEEEKRKEEEAAKRRPPSPKRGRPSEIMDSDMVSALSILTFAFPMPEPSLLNGRRRWQRHGQPRQKIG